MRFLFAWQHVEASSVLTGPDGVRAVLARLDGVELPARAWERDVIAARVERYDPATLDMLCLTGRVGWARLSTGPTQVVGATPIALFLREHADAWLALRSVRLKPDPTSDTEATTDVGAGLSRLDVGAGFSRLVLDRLRSHGAAFVLDLATACEMTEDQVHSALAELVAAGLVSSDGFAGLRSLIGTRRDSAGRWFIVRPPSRPGASGEARPSDIPREAAVETLAWTLLRRYGVVFRRLLARQAAAVPWRELAYVYRRLEARGEIRGGRFVSA